MAIKDIELLEENKMRIGDFKRIAHNHKIWKLNTNSEESEVPIRYIKAGDMVRTDEGSFWIKLV